MKNIRFYNDGINVVNNRIILRLDLNVPVKNGFINDTTRIDLCLPFIKNLTDKLLQWTGERWIISLSKNVEAKSIYEKNLENQNQIIDEFKKSKIAKDLETAFPDAKLTEIKEEE